MKYLKIHSLFRNTYYRRTYDQKEIDYLEEFSGELHGFEIKWKEKKLHLQKDFLETYAKSSMQLVNQESFWDFVEGKI